MEEGICPPELLMTCESSKSRQELVSRIWDFSLKACFSGASESVPLIFQEPCEQVAGIYCTAPERPVVQAPVLSEQSSSSLCFVSHHRYWDREVLRAKKDAREPSLMKAITSCYWKFCLVLGLLTFLEVKSFPYCALLLSVCRSVLIWMRWWGERTVA